MSMRWMEEPPLNGLTARGLSHRWRCGGRSPVSGLLSPYRIDRAVLPAAGTLEQGTFINVPCLEMYVCSHEVEWKMEQGIENV